MLIKILYFIIVTIAIKAMLPRLVSRTYIPLTENTFSEWHPDAETCRRLILFIICIFVRAFFCRCIDYKTRTV
jgi:hypothetical protein